MKRSLRVSRSFREQMNRGMTGIWRRAVLAPVCVFTVALYLFGAAIPPNCSAQPPGKAACDSGDSFDKLKCKHDSVTSQIEHMSGTVFGTGTHLGGQLTAGQQGLLEGVKLKSARSKTKTGSGDFKKLAKSEAKSNKQTCYFVPYYDANGIGGNDTNNDGICDYEQNIGDGKNAKCAAIELDADKNLQICNPHKKNKGKGKGGTDLECDLICDPDEGSVAETDEMVAEAMPMAEALGGLETDLYQLNGDLEEINTRHAELQISRSAMATGSCTIPETTPGLDLASGILHQVSVTARGLAGMSGTGCEQTAVALGFGGNGSVVCLVFETAASILELAYVTVDEILKIESGALQSSTMSCLKQMQGDVTDGFANLYREHAEIKANDNANRDLILAQIEQVRAELVNILSTPLGQRAAFPVK